MIEVISKVRTTQVVDRDPSWKPQNGICADTVSESGNIPAHKSSYNTRRREMTDSEQGKEAAVVEN